MAKVLQLRRGSSASLDSTTGAEGEIFVDLDSKTVRVHDGVTQGGYSLAKSSELAAKAPLASPALTGTPTAPTASSGTSTTQIATTAFVGQELTAKAPLASPALTGTPTAPTASSGTSTTQIATTAFVADAVSQVPTVDLSSVNEDIVPAFDGAFDIGSQAKSFDSLYLKTGINFFGNNSITASASGLSFAGNTTFNGNIVSTGNITTTGDITAADGVLDTLLAGELLITDDVITPTPLNGCAVGTLTVNGAACVSGGTLTIACGGLSIQQGNLNVANGGITAQSLTTTGSISAANLTTTGSISAAGLTSSCAVTVCGGINVLGSYCVYGVPLASSPYCSVGNSSAQLINSGILCSVSTRSAILGGSNNFICSNCSLIGAGESNQISSFSNRSSIVAGCCNLLQSQSEHSFIGSGSFITVVSSCHSGVVAGCSNTLNAGSNFSIIGSGLSNTIGNYSSSSAIVGGNQNTISFYSSFSGIASGSSNTICSYSGESFIGGGRYNCVNAYNGTIAGGCCNTASGCAFVGGGFLNRATGNFSAILGGFGACATQHGQQAHAAGYFSNPGDAQAISFVARGKTFSGSQTSTLALDGYSTLFAIENGYVYRLTATILGITSNGGTVAAYERQFTVKNISNTASLVGTVATIGTDCEDDAAYNVSISANNSTKTLTITVTGDTSNTVRWVAHVTGTQLAYGS